MIPDDRDTIVAVATPLAGAHRGAVRLSGPDTLLVLQRLIARLPDDLGSVARRWAGQTAVIQLDGREHSVPCDLFLWPTSRSYTRQPSAELHTIGSPPVLSALVQAACDAGARLAEPGEFTLRAFLAGRIDLTQAEAVLGVIEAPGEVALRSALGQLAGGLSKPLHALREDLLSLLADLEAGLDFVEEEDIRFVESAELFERLEAARLRVSEVAEQMVARGRRDELPRVALVGPPNAGKSSLFNMLRRRFGAGPPERPDALVSDIPGTTRDSLTAVIEVNSCRFQLIDTAGIEHRELMGPEGVADALSRRDAAAANLRVSCLPVGHAFSASADPASTGDQLAVLTKVDTAGGNPHAADLLATSSVTGQGITELAYQIVRSLGASQADGESHLVASTAERCRNTLAAAASCLQRATEVARLGEHDLVAFEIRSSLEHLGQVVGAVVTDDILDRIFSQFCIGK